MTIGRVCNASVAFAVLPMVNDGPHLRTVFAIYPLAELMMTREECMTGQFSARIEELSEEMGWSMDRAQGYVDGGASQQSGEELSPSHRFGMDEYSKGFRTGYYTQACSLTLSSIREALEVA